MLENKYIYTPKKAEIIKICIENQSDETSKKKIVNLFRAYPEIWMLDMVQKGIDSNIPAFCSLFSLNDFTFMASKISTQNRPPILLHKLVKLVVSLFPEKLQDFFSQLSNFIDDPVVKFYTKSIRELKFFYGEKNESKPDQIFIEKLVAIRSSVQNKLQSSTDFNKKQYIKIDELIYKLCKMKGNGELDNNDIFIKIINKSKTSIDEALLMAEYLQGIFTAEIKHSLDELSLQERQKLFHAVFNGEIVFEGNKIRVDELVQEKIAYFLSDVNGTMSERTAARILRELFFCNAEQDNNSIEENIFDTNNNSNTMQNEEKESDVTESIGACNLQ